jgi:DGQHR domain-containing protein
MSEFLGNLLTERVKIEASLRQRKKKVIEKSIQANNPELLDEKLALEEKDGWKLLRKNKTSYRIAMDKPLDEQLEDEVWSILAQMQFKEMSDGRLFKILTDKGTEPRQIDVFAKDEEVAIFIECTRSETPGSKPLANLIQKIESYRLKVSNSLVNHYGRDSKLKQKWVIATRNIEWSPADLGRAKAANIEILTEIQLDYYKKLTQLYKLGAKYQLLSHLFAKEKIQGLELTVPATKGKMGGIEFFNFLINPLDLIKIAHVSHKASRDVSDVETYQRLLKPKRLKELAAYIDDGGQFPTNIVLNIRAGKRGLRFDKKNSYENSSYGELTLPSQYGTAMVIDGQHRLYGYTYSDRVLNSKYTNATIPVLAYVNLPPSQEAKLFVDINCEQVRVDRNLVKEIHSELYMDSDDKSLQLDALRSKVIVKLNGIPGSPIYDRLKLSTKDGTYLRCLTLNNFIDGLRDNKFFGEIKGSGFRPGPFTDSTKPDDLNATVQKACEILKHYFNVFSSIALYHWDLGNLNKEKESLIGYLATNEGVRALLVVLKDILDHIKKESNLDPSYLDSPDLNPKIEKLAIPIADVFKSAQYGAIHQFRTRSGGKKGVNINSKFLESFINKQIPTFNPPGLNSFLDDMDEEGTKEAKGLIGEMVMRMQEFVIYKLKEAFPGQTTTGKPKWWYEGIPETIRTQCVSLSDKGKGEKEPEQYLDIVHYQTIASKNWNNIFRESFSFIKGGKDVQLEWISQLNTIRNITHHENKWPATKEQVSFVKEYYRLVMDRFNIPEKVTA